MKQIIFGVFLTLLCVLCTKADQERIVGGEINDISQHPYQVSLRRRRLMRPDNAFTHTCGGSAFNERIVITAAHCLIGAVPSQYIVVAGASYSSGTFGFISRVKKFIFHEDYDPDNHNNDIGIVLLEIPLKFNSFNKMPLPLTDREYGEGAIATLSGFGTLQSRGTIPFELHAVNVPIVSREHCNEDYGGGSRIKASMICAGLRGVGGKDSCQGDSGGPLVINGKLVGVVSWGLGCANRNYPGVYTNVYYFRFWLEEKIAEYMNDL